jgi:hypothetical protein
MADKTQKISKAYSFFNSSEENGSHFSLEDLSKSTGWSLKTIIAYKSKKWKHFLKQDENGLFCEGIKTLTYEEFVNLHRQSINYSNITFQPQTQYLEKSREFALLAIQTYNNPIIKFRFYGFIIDMIIAYTSLFHAIFSRENIEFWYKENGKPKIIDGEYKYWELSTCVDKYFVSMKNPVESNIKLFIGLRNIIEHKNLPNLDLVISGYAQALLRNYENLLVKEFGISYSLSPSLTLAIQLSSFSEEYAKTIRTISSNTFDSIKDYINQFCMNLSQDIIQSDIFCFKVFVIPKIGNHASSSDKTIEFIKLDTNNQTDIDLSEKIIGLIKEKTIQVADQGKLLASVVAKEVEKRTQKKFSGNMHTKAWKLYKVRTKEYSPYGCNTLYCSFSEPFKRFIYTHEWVDFLCEKVLDDIEYNKIIQFK